MDPEAGLVFEQGPLRVHLSVSHGADFEGGHPENQGISPTGQVVPVPDYRHEVSLDWWRVELGVRRELSPSWSAWLRVPYDVKERVANVVLIDSATDEEQDDMQRSVDLHHPTRTLRGLADPQLVLAHRMDGPWHEQGQLVLAFGTSLPLGRIEEDPYAQGDAGQPHEHIQFGTGTFDPLLEAYFTIPVGERLYFTLSANGRFPLYENRHGYEGPPEVALSLGLSRRLDERWSVVAGWSSFFQGRAHWQGDLDPNSGFVAHGVVAGVGYSRGSGTSTTLTLQLPVSQEARSSQGETFEQGPILRLGVSYGF